MPPAFKHTGVLPTALGKTPTYQQAGARAGQRKGARADHEHAYAYVRKRFIIMGSTKGAAVSGHAPRAHCAPHVCRLKATPIADGPGNGTNGASIRHRLITLQLEGIHLLQ